MRSVLRHLVVAFALVIIAQSSQAQIFVAYLDGPSEAVPNASPGTGMATVYLDPLAHTMRVQAQFADLLGTVTASHIHSATAVPGAGAAGVATPVPSFPGFPSGVTSGSYDHWFDMTLASSYNPSFVTANGGTPASAEAALFAGIMAGKAYLNIHSSVFPGGEIRGFLNPVPEPGTLAFAGGIALLGVLTLVRRRR